MITVGDVRACANYVLVWASLFHKMRPAAQRLLTALSSLPDDAQLGVLPVAPQPDWSQSPEWAQWWAYSAHNDACWHRTQPEVRYGNWVSEHNTEGEPPQVARDLTVPQWSLPIGVDWRTTLTRRPD